MIGIIVAEMKELQAVEEKMLEKKAQQIYELNFIEGILGNKKCVVAKSGGVGKVNAARTTQILINNYKLDCIINVGVAGALNNKLNIGDIVIGKSMVQYDFDLTAFGRKRGEIDNIGERIEADKNLIEKCREIINTVLKENENKVMIGTIATGDIFCTKLQMKEEIIKEFKADCIEMEGAAIAQVCKLDKVPFMVIRSVSDKVDGSNETQFETYLEKSSKICSNFLEKLMMSL